MTNTPRALAMPVPKVAQIAQTGVTRASIMAVPAANMSRVTYICATK